MITKHAKDLMVKSGPLPVHFPDGLDFYSQAAAAAAERVSWDQEVQSVHALGSGFLVEVDTGHVAEGEGVAVVAWASLTGS